MAQKNSLRSGAGLGGTDDPRLLTDMAAKAASTVPDGPVAGCAGQCDDTPTPLPDDISRMCSGKGGPYAGTEGAERGCEYYRWRHNDFVKRHQGCRPPIPEPPAYYLDYGEKYCNRFSKETRDKLTPEGQIWLDKTRCALQRKIEDALLEKPGIEKDHIFFETTAFATHSDAYVKSGLGALPLEDHVNIAWTPDFKEWLHGETWKQAWETGKKIAPDYGDAALGKITHYGTISGNSVYDDFYVDF
jgi:hypothetical protein